jgi:membrane-bound ClpP family serine protease
MDHVADGIELFMCEAAQFVFVQAKAAKQSGEDEEQVRVAEIEGTVDTLALLASQSSISKAPKLA